MNQMMTSSPSVQLVKVHWLLLLFLLSVSFLSCQQQASPSLEAPEQMTAPQSYREGDVDFPLGGEFALDLSAQEQELRAIDAQVDYRLNERGRHAITLPNSLPVVCILRSSGSDLPTYVEVQAQRDAQTGRYRVVRERVKLRAGSSLAPGKKWYLMIAMGGTFDRNAQEIRFGSSAPDTGADGTATIAAGGRKLDIPAASHWVELPMHPSGQPKWPKDWTPAERSSQRLTLYPQGVLCRATLRLDDSYKQKIGGARVEVKVSKLTLVSTALSFAGKFSLSPDRLPALNFASQSLAQRGGANSGHLLTWIPTQVASTQLEYPSLDQGVAEYTKVFTSPSGSVLKVSGGASDAIFEANALPTTAQRKALPTGVEAILFWAIPTPRTTELRTTLIAEEGTSSSASILAPKRTYVYGKRHPHQVLSGKSVYFDAIYYQPHTPLDFMAVRNLARATPGAFRVGGTFPEQLSNDFATGHGVDASALANRTPTRGLQLRSSDNGVTKSTAGRLYKTPTQAQFESVYPVSLDAVRVQRETANRRLDSQPIEVSVAGVTSQTRYSFRKASGQQVAYALALEGFEGKNRRRVAYRYSYLPNPEVQGLPNSLGANALLMIQNGEHTFRRDHDGGTYPVSKHYLRIEAIHLGAYYLGTVDDIARDAFWEDNRYRKEVRFLSENTTPMRRFISASTASLRNWEGGVSTTSYRILPTRGGKDDLLLVMNSLGGARITTPTQDRKPMMSNAPFSVRLFTTEER